MKTTFHDVGSGRCDERKYTALHAYSTHGRSKYRIACPFCGAEIDAFKWSLAGTGKRCGCGALFGSLGTAYRLRADNHSSASTHSELDTKGQP